MMACEICKKPYVPSTDDSSLAFDGKPHLCKICGKTFALKIQLKRHLVSHEGNAPYICNACEKNLDQSSSYNLRLSKKGNFACETCNESFSTKRSLLRHAGEHTLENILNCDECGQCFKNRATLKRHVAIHKPTKSQSKNIYRKQSDETSYQCQECGKNFAKFPQFEAHCFNHRKYSCGECNVYFASDILLKEHNGNTHSNGETKKQECSLCSKSFARKSALEGHMLTHFMDNHESPAEDDSDKDVDFQCNLKEDNELCLPKLKIRRSFPCEKCSLVFFSKISLNKHTLSHIETTSDSLRKTYVCRICKETFGVKEDYKRHKLTHNRNESSLPTKTEKTYTCQFCLKVFAKKKHLKKHIKTHLDESGADESNFGKASGEESPSTFHSGKKEKRAKTYSCSFCGKLFAGEICWKKHEAKHTEETEKEESVRKNKKGKKAKILICEYCNEDFTGKRHIFVKHRLSHTPEVCGICDARFQDRSSLREHCRIHIGTEEGRRFLECSQKVLDAKNGAAHPEPKVEYIYLVLR